MRLELASLIPPEFLRGQPARTLNKAAFDLAHVDRRVQRLAAVMQDIHPSQSMLACQSINNHLGHSRAISEVKKWPAAKRRSIVVYPRRGVKTRGRQLYPIEPGELRQLRETDYRAAGVNLVVPEFD